MITAYKEGECPEVTHMGIIDYKKDDFESYDTCNITGDRCIIQYGLYRCEYFEKYLEERVK